MSEEQIQAQIYLAVQQVISAVEEISGLASRWNREISLVDQATANLLSPKRFNAKKDWDCGITIVTDILADPMRWRTLIHEALHSVSMGLTQDEYNRNRGWEEGVVEALQRIYRPEILARLQVRVSEERFREQEQTWLFGFYIEALQRIAEQIPSVSEREFFERLLAVPLKERATFVFEWGLRDATDREQFKRVFAEASGILRK